MAYFKIKYDGYPNKYIEIDLDSRKDVSINIRHNYLTQRILNMISGMDKSSAKPNPVVKHTLAKNKGYQARKNDFNYRSVVKPRNFLTNSMPPKAQFAVHQCARFSTDTKLPHDKTVKCVLKSLKGMSRLYFPEELCIFCYFPVQLSGTTLPNATRTQRRNTKGTPYLPALQMIYIHISYVGLP